MSYKSSSSNALYSDLSNPAIKCYRKLSNIRSTNSQYLNDLRLVLNLSLPYLLNPGVK